MKKIIPLIAICILMTQLAFAQAEGDPRGSRLKTLEIAYLSRELNLTPAEAEKFWPVYYKYSDEMKSTQKNREGGDVIERQQQMLDIRKKYKADFTRILSAERTNKLFEAEVRFRELVKRELQERRQMQQNRLRKGNR
jgi:hypothetical protein